MPEFIEPEDPDQAVEEIVALQNVRAEDEDVQAHNFDPVGGASNFSAVSTVVC